MSNEKFIWNHEDVNFDSPFFREPATKKPQIPTEEYTANRKPKFQKLKFRRNKPNSVTNFYGNGI